MVSDVTEHKYSEENDNHQDKKDELFFDSRAA